METVRYFLHIIMAKISYIILSLPFLLFVAGLVFLTKASNNQEAYGNVYKVKGGPYNWVPVSVLPANLNQDSEKRLWDMYL